MTNITIINPRIAWKSDSGIYYTICLLFNHDFLTTMDIDTLGRTNNLHTLKSVVCLIR